VARTRMTRHELKEKDEITTSLQKLTDIAYAWKKPLIVGGSALLVIILALVGWRVYANSRNTRASLQLAQVIRTYDDATKPDKERYTATITEAQKTVDAYGSLPAGAIARYYIGLSQEALGDTAKAVENLQAASDRGDETIKGTAQFALAGIHRKHGEGPKAIEVYKQLYDTGLYSKSAVAYELGSLYEATEQPNQARDYYQKILAEFPDSPFRQPAEEALKRMGVTITPAPTQSPS
jgi:predicted negative regulator of RcsB-dependent stress response